MGRDQGLAGERAPTMGQSFRVVRTFDPNERSIEPDRKLHRRTEEEIKKVEAKLDLPYRHLQADGYKCASKCLDNEKLGEYESSECETDCFHHMNFVDSRMNLFFDNFRKRVDNCAVLCLDRAQVKYHETMYDYGNKPKVEMNFKNVEADIGRCMKICALEHFPALVGIESKVTEIMKETPPKRKPTPPPPPGGWKPQQTHASKFGW